ncbi:MAG TPA: 5-formyltetrahydrofolate cyclo-ligase [Luteimonas sp.]|uniref:5-formyltetrahydrofolate cyclo-ligase n=1 Tax=Cognatiluteimonas lumbrici TaxID=2559601 RepID=UPI00112E2B42|nr:5-formyltetrahydrofolate cyclo-ligase [Luteimonas lumbrici]HLT44610.1 5-formyltetrahydrofolate cyclo-ligase [Luteimonas sp.]
MKAARDARRRELRERRRALPAATRIAAAEALAAQLLALPFSPASGAVAGYWAMDGEIALHAWQLRLPAAVRYCLPVLCEDDLLRFAPWRPGAPLAPNRFGIPEPVVARDALLEASELGLAVLPLVAFDASCHRLGMGGGWYDRTFAFRNAPGGSPPPWLVGVGFALQQVDAIERAPWDVPLDAACTEQATFMGTRE